MQYRAKLFGGVESGFVGSSKAEKDASKAHQEVYEKALSLVVSKNKDVFGLDKDTDGKTMSAATKADYGNTNIGKGCLLAASWLKPAPRAWWSAAAWVGTCTAILPPA